MRVGEQAKSETDHHPKHGTRGFLVGRFGARGRHPRCRSRSRITRDYRPKNRIALVYGRCRSRSRSRKASDGGLGAAGASVNVSAVRAPGVGWRQDSIVPGGRQRHARPIIFSRGVYGAAGTDARERERAHAFSAHPRGRRLGGWAAGRLGEGARNSRPSPSLPPPAPLPLPHRPTTTATPTNAPAAATEIVRVRGADRNGSGGL